MKKSLKKSMSCFNQAGSKRKKPNKKMASPRKVYQREISGKRESSVLLKMRTKLNQQRNEFLNFHTLALTLCPDNLFEIL